MSWHKNLTDPITSKAVASVEAPLGFNDPVKAKSTAHTQPSQSQLEELKKKKIWDLAIGPGKQIPMNLFMSWMSGSSLQIIPITMTLMLFKNTINAILSTNSMFKPLETKNNSNDITLAKIVYFALNMVIIGIGLYKLDTMGLVPRKTGDWLSWEEQTIWSNVVV